MTKGDTDWVSGNIYIRPRSLTGGKTVAGHRHTFDHTHLVQSGWWLVRGWVDGVEVVLQKASAEYSKLRAMRLQYAPHTVPRPIRFPDVVRQGQAEFVVKFINQNDAIPHGGEEIIFAPTGYHCLIHAGTLHDMVALDDGLGLCIYSHREPQGEIALQRNGWDGAYT